MPSVELVEVGPRDGLQNEPGEFPTARKLDFIERAIAAGVRRIEAASFVHPRLVPQMSDAEAVAAGLPRHREGVTYIGLALNKRGADRALVSGLDEIGAVCAASDAFATRNQGMSAHESLRMCVDIVKMAREAGRRAQISISVAFGCPFEGEIEPDRIVDMARLAASAYPVEVALADTIGAATPGPVASLVARVVAAIRPIPVRVHFHNTRNAGIANTWAAVTAGARVIDASLGGIGGCPFAPRATGNVATEDIAYMLNRSGYQTGLSLERLVDCVQWLEKALGRPTPGMLARAGIFPKADNGSSTQS
jgi:hydroxymethylglutaryl-CoA lyase